MPPTTHELKQFLAEQLEDEVLYEDNFYWKCGSKFNPYKNGHNFPIFIRETEWEAIMRMVEGKLDENQKFLYWKALYRHWIDNKQSKVFDWWILFSLDWPTRAIALKEVLKG